MATQRRRHLPRKRLVTAVIAILLLCGSALLWILNTEHRIQGDWSNILPIGFIVLGVIFAFLAWLFPFSPDQHETSHLPRASELVWSSFKMGDV
jgi:hypothetical protein